jgi:hypothetical protein
MTLANLLAIQRLQAFEASPQGVQRLLAAAERNLADAQLQALSRENRFDAAYKCILQCAMLGPWAQGYRTSASQPGHLKAAIDRVRGSNVQEAAVASTAPAEMSLAS